MNLTSKGAVKRESAGANIKVLDVDAAVGEMIIAVVGYVGEPPQGCFMGDAFKMRRCGQRVDDTNGFGVTQFSSGKIFDAITADVTVTWLEDIGARVMAVYTVDEYFFEDQVAVNLMTASTTPHTGYTDEHAFRDSLVFGTLCSNGPQADDAPTLEAGWTVGERKGTDLATPADNVTIQVGYQATSAADGVRLRGTGATERNWANVECVLRPASYPILDRFEFELAVGDTVDYFGSSYTIASMVQLIGTIGQVTLSNGNAVWSYHLDKDVD